MKIKVYYLPFILVFMLCILVIIMMSNVHPENVKNTNTIVTETNSIDWYIPRTSNNERPSFPAYVQEFIDKYGIYVMGKGEKELYLTFNCGYEYNNYTEEVLNILKEENIKAVFFITGDYLRSNSEIVKRMIDEGHIVGNHGNTHAFLSELSEDEIRKEIIDFEKAYEDVTGVKFSKKYFRPASGAFSEQVLVIANDLSYETVFWSLAYKDWETDHQPSTETVYNNIMNGTHDGCILMLHTVSISNKNVLKEAIRDLKEKSYIFKSIEEFR
ncbi:MAG: polysaccharide deacetylase family protein [Eubacteriales bacterium]